MNASGRARCDLSPSRLEARELGTGVGVARVDAERLLERLAGAGAGARRTAGAVPGSSERAAERDVVARVAGLDGDRLAIGLHRARGVAGLHARRAEAGPHAGVAGAETARALVGAGGVVVAAGLERGARIGAE